MQRIKKAYVWVMLVALVVSLFPAGLTKSAHAATNQATYFIPDDLKLRSTSQLTTQPTGGIQIDRDNVLVTSSPTLTITGTYSYVTEDSMKVTVEQLSSKPVIGQPDQIDWVTDPTHFKAGSISKDPSSTSTQKFKATNLPLFSGFNKITLSGSQNGIDRSDVFYVLFDQVPYVQNLKLLGSSLGEIYLNEGTQVVSDKDTVSLQGDVNNATDVTVAVNKGRALVSTLTQTGKFFSPALKLSPGLNTLTVTIKSGADSVSVDRQVYYFDKKNPFIELTLNYDGKDYNLLNNIPTLTGNVVSNPSGKLTATILLDDTGKPFADAGVGSIVVGNTTLPSSDYNVTSEVTIPAPDGVTPAYRLVTFEIPALAFDPAVADQKINLSYAYDNKNNASTNLVFKYLPGQVGIVDVKYLKDYQPGNKLADTSVMPLDGTEMEKDTFYVLVEADQNLDTLNPQPKLEADYMPVGSATIVDVPTASQPSDKKNTQRVYQVTGFSTGKQQVRFHFTGSNAYFTVNIGYATKNYIYVENIYDGQTFKIDSSSPTPIQLKGEYRDFENLSSAQLFVNGISSDKMNPDPKFNVDNSNKTFNVSLNIDINGPLYYGENRIVLSGVSMDGKGNSRTVRKELRIYIIDTNISNITTFQPSLANDATRESFVGLDLGQTTSNPKLDNILARSPQFKYEDGKFETSEQKYDLVIQGGGAKIVNVNLGSQKFFSTLDQGIDLTKTTTSTELKTGSFTYQGKTYNYEMAVLNDKFILRINNIPFDTPGTHVYNAELINTTGARANQRLEITRVLAPFRILSPKATVGDQIVVNKNFVRFDIEAEGATKVLIGKDEATKRTDMNNRFFYDYVGLKPDKATKIKIQIIRGTETINQTVEVYYTSAVTVDTQYMTEKPANKYTAFNKGLTLSFPKGTVLKTANVATGEVAKFYPDNKYLFAIADPKDGVVERRNDYGDIINLNNDQRTPNGGEMIKIPTDLVEFFNMTGKTANFTRVSNVYWISGGYGEKASIDSPDYKPSTNGLPPYSIEGNFRDIDLLEPERKLAPSQRGELTLSYNNNVVDDAGTTITVFRFNDNAEWENIGGAVDTKSHTITVPFDEFGYYMVMKQSKGYPDITNHPWARNLLNALYSKGIMPNVLPDAFGADDLTTRGEFASLLVKGLDLPLNYDPKVQTYFDVTPGAKTETWDFKYIETASRAGIVTGLADGSFGVEEPITREQAAVMVARAMKLKLAVNDDKLKTSLDKQFMDSGQMEVYSRPAISAVTKAKIMEGQPVTMPNQKKPSYNFNPKSNMTRAEAGKIVVELFKKSTKIFPKNLS